MAVFVVEVVEVVVYRGQIEASDPEAARTAALDDLVANSGLGHVTFAEVADRTVTIVDE